ncbi:MAG TPA: hypothetical protein VEL79_07990 [Vicinamibacterales bacterium]|nr:hypothetical protein [Vicinamibacterales bacterium]
MSEPVAAPQPADAGPRYTRRSEDRARPSPPPPTARLELERRAPSTLRRQDKKLPTWKKLLGPKERPPSEWLWFTKRYGGRFWPLSWIGPYL